MDLLHEILDRTAQRVGDREALCSQSDRLCYTDLLAEANRIANSLRVLGVASGDRVGLYLDKSVMAVAAVFGILKTGACYVPVDKQIPVIRLQTIVQQCGINTIVTTANNIASLFAIHQQTGLAVQLLLMDDEKFAEQFTHGLHIITRADLDQEDPSLTFKQNISVDAAAAILMTSGTTGKPKGAVLTHKNVVIFSQWVVERFQLGIHDRLASHAPMCFDLSLLDIFATVSAGASAVLVPSNKTSNPGFLLRLIDQEKITL